MIFFEPMITRKFMTTYKNLFQKTIKNIFSMITFNNNKFYSFFINITIYKYITKN